MKIMAQDSSGDSKMSKKETSSLPLYRWVLTTLIFLLVAGYTIALITGAIKSANKVDAVDLGLIALAGLFIVALVNPEVLQRIRIFEVGSIRFELQQITKKQSDQQEALDGVRMVLSMLLPESEQNHLVNLLIDKVSRYGGGYPMRTELRHLRSLGLIRMRSDHTVEEMRSNMVFDLSDYVQLTDLGQKSAQWINDARAAKKEALAKEASD